MKFRTSKTVDKYIVLKNIRFMILTYNKEKIEVSRNMLNLPQFLKINKCSSRARIIVLLMASHIKAFNQTSAGRPYL